jgi:hypothetical protein
LIYDAGDIVHRSTVTIRQYKMKGQEHFVHSRAEENK